MAARASADFIESVGFDKQGDAKSENSFGRLRTVSFNYTKQDVNGRDVEAEVELPLLSLVPIPLLQVKDAQLSFSLKIIETDSETEQRRAGVAGTAFAAAATTSPTPSRAVSMRAVYKASNNTDTTIDMKVTLNLVQSDMPAGLQQLFQIMEQASTSKQTQSAAASDTSATEVESRATMTAALDTVTPASSLKS